MKNLKGTKDLIEYSNNMQSVYKNIEDYNSRRKSNVLTAFDDIIADTISNKKLSPIVSELFIKEINLNFLLFLSHNLISEY